ncbi:MAG: DsrE family protein [Rhodospirillales bacterium]
MKHAGFYFLPRTVLAALAFCAAAHVIAADGAAATQAAARAAAKDRVVFQVSDADPKKWTLALNNAKNIQTDLGRDNVVIEIVAYGPGIGMLKADSEVRNRIEEATAAGVRLVACQNTMTSQKLDKADMLDNISYAPAGVVEIMRRQQEGYVYIRP